MGERHPPPRQWPAGPFGTLWSGLLPLLPAPPPTWWTCRVGSAVLNPSVLAAAGEQCWPLGSSVCGAQGFPEDPLP